MKAKDPAFLFYPADASQDTQFMNRLERGAYFDLVKGQRIYGGYTVVQLRKILGNDFDAVWPSLELVMEFDGERYHVGWLKLSLYKREEYSKKQSDRVSKRWNNGGNTVVLPKKENEIVNETVIEDKSKIETEKTKRKVFVRPELKEVLDWMRNANMAAGNLWKDERIVAEAKKFWNYYESKGWVVGRSPMKKWDAAARNWMNNANKFDNGNGTTTKSGTKQAVDYNRVGAEALSIVAANYGLTGTPNQHTSQGEQAADGGEGDFTDFQIVQ